MIVSGHQNWNRWPERRRAAILANQQPAPSTSALNVPCRHDRPSNHTPHQLQLSRLSSPRPSTIKSPSCVPEAHSLVTPALNWDMLLPSTHHQPPDLSYIRRLLSLCRQNRRIPSFLLEPCFAAVSQEVTSHSDLRRLLLHRCVLKGLLALWAQGFILSSLS